MSQGKQDKASPVMIRTYHAGCKGATAFFRNRPFLDEFFKLLTSTCEEKCTILVHAASIGVEPYSLALWWLHRFRKSGLSLTVHATDINAAFLQEAQRAIYPLEILEGMCPEEISWFQIKADGVHVPQQARDIVNFLPAMSFVDGNPGNNFDAVLVMNALTYVTPQQQHEAIHKIANYSRHILALTAFHPDTIRQDIQEVDFFPHLGSAKEIHSAWGDRLADRPIDPTSSEYSWKLPSFATAVPDHEYRFCTLFVRSKPIDNARQMEPKLKNAVDDLVKFAIERHQAGDLAGAQALYGKAIELYPSHPVALHNLGLIYLDRGDLSSATLLLAEAVRQRPTEAAFNYNYALALQQQGNLQQALQHYGLALKDNPAYREAWENQGVVLQDLECFDEAINSYQQALKLDPTSQVASRNLGNVLRVAGRLDEALAHYRRTIDHTPMSAEIQFGYGATLITQGDFTHGWPFYEWRFWSPEFLERNPPYRVPLPRWDGSEIRNKTLLVYGEQGVGDEIMFASCLDDLAGQVCKLRVLCEPRLVQLFARSFRSIEVAPKTGDHPSHDEEGAWMADCCVAMGSLPRQLRPTEQSFPAKPYLLADQQAVESWRQRLAALGQGLKIGISWRGGAESRARNARSIALERFAPLFAQSHVTFVNVQYGDHAKEIGDFNSKVAKPLMCFAEIDPLNDMDGFAALLSALDLVIAVDNSTVHLAGALGVPTWLLLPAHADWRWLKGREATPWYASVRIFWQKKHENAAWDEVIARLNVALDSLASSSWTTKSTVLQNPGSASTSVQNHLKQGKPVALLLNDTSYWYHWGCTATSLALHEGLRAKGYGVDSVAITDFNRLSPLPASIEDFDSETFYQRFIEANPELHERIRRCDAVVINGEGTLHGLSRTALALLYTAYFSKRWLNRNTRIINHSCYPDAQGNSGQSLTGQVYRKVYGALDFIAVRENHSAGELARMGVQAQESFDCLPLYLRQHGPMPQTADQARKRVVMAGSVALTPTTIDTLAKLANAVISFGYELQILVGANAYLAADDIQLVNALHRQLKGKYSLITAHSESTWLNTIAGASLLVSGRFHHTIAAAFLGTPAAVAASNTRKMEGLLERLQLPSESVWLNIDNPLQTIDTVSNLLRNPQTGLVKSSVLAHLRELATLNFSNLP